MKYTAYKGSQYEYKTTIREIKRFNGKNYELYEVFANYGGIEGHKTAINFASETRTQGNFARVDAHSGFTAVYVRGK
jgi:hypothetical protein